MAIPLRAVAVLGPLDPSEAPARTSYVERPAPAASPSAAVACTWVGHAGRSRSLRVLPDGCADLAWDGTRVRIAPPRPGLVRYPVTATAVQVGVRLRPGWAGAVLGAGVAGIAPGASLAEALPAGVAIARRYEDELTVASSPAVRGAVLARLVDELLGRNGPPDSRALRAADLLATGAVGSPSGAATAVGLGDRQLRRLFDSHVGLSPQAFGSVRRFQRFLTGIRAAPAAGHRPLASWAADYGYYDQSHLARDCRRFAGVPPSAVAAPLGSSGG